MRALITGILIAMLACAAVAQTMDNKLRPPAPPTTNGAAALPQAPVGHRQPTEKNLPPRVRQEETDGRATVDPLGPLPQLCKGC